MSFEQPLFKYKFPIDLNENYIYDDGYNFGEIFKICLISVFV